MKRIIAVVLLSVLALAGCSKASDTKTNTTGGNTGYSQEEIDRAFVATLEQKGMPASDAAYAIETAHKVCTVLDSGTTFREFMMGVLSQPNVDATMTGYIVGAAIAAYCPSHLNEIQ
jgi:uncharacterized lipoprotein YajG